VRALDALLQKGAKIKYPIKTPLIYKLNQKTTASTKKEFYRNFRLIGVKYLWNLRCEGRKHTT